MNTGKDTLTRLYDLVREHASNDPNMLELLDAVASLNLISIFTNSLDIVELPCTVRGMPTMSQGFVDQNTLFLYGGEVYADGAQHVFSPSKAYDGCVLIYRDKDGYYFADFCDCDLSELEHRTPSSFDVLVSKTEI